MSDDDPELQELRKQRLAQLQAQQAQGRPNPQQQQQAAQQQKQAEDQRNMILQQILTPEAKERLNRVALVKPDLARMVGDRMIQMAQSRQLSSKVEDKQLKTWLEQAGEQTAKPTITFSRKQRADDDD